VSKRVDLFDSTYGNFRERVLEEIRRETFGEDIGQNSWITVEEWDTFTAWLELGPKAHLLEIASGSGRPALYLARKHGCRITGIDVNDEAVTTARQAAAAAGSPGVRFERGDMNERLPFDDGTFDGVVCVDSMNHFRDRLGVFREWYRVLRSGGRAVFTDPVVITGPVSNEELAARSNIGFFLFVPPEVTERFINAAGLRLLRREDATGNIEMVSGRWLESRARHKEDLVKLEGEERFEGLQLFFAAVHELTSQRRLSRFVFLAEK
jgi:SAM-dependent methyltransferase